MEQNILMNLSWNASLESQTRAINEIVSMTNLNPNSLIQPLGKEYWENAAKALVEIGYPRIGPAIPGLFGWLKDLNWPGAMIVMNLLKSLPQDVVIKYLESAAIEAVNTDDEIWLINLSTFLTDLKLQENDFLSKDIYYALINVE